MILALSVENTNLVMGCFDGENQIGIFHAQRQYHARSSFPLVLSLFYLKPGK